MERITREAVEETFSRMNSLAAEDGARLTHRMTKEHPLVVAYLMRAGEDLLDDDEREHLMFLGMVIWQIMDANSLMLPEVTANILRDAENKNLEMVKFLEGESADSFLSTAQMLMDSYNQHEILKYIMREVLEEDEDALAISAEGKFLILLFLKTAIDCFDRPIIETTAA